MHAYRGMRQHRCLALVLTVLFMFSIVHAEIIKTPLIDRTPAKKGMVYLVVADTACIGATFPHTALCYHFDKSGMMIDMITCSCNTCSSMCTSMPTCYYSQWGALPVVRVVMMHKARKHNYFESAKVGCVVFNYQNTVWPMQVDNRVNVCDQPIPINGALMCQGFFANGSAIASTKTTKSVVFNSESTCTDCFEACQADPGCTSRQWSALPVTIFSVQNCPPPAGSTLKTTVATTGTTAK